MEKYVYKVDEKSLTQNLLIRLIWTPILQILPAKLKPNTITIVGFFFMLLSGASVIFSLHNNLRWPFLVAAVSLFMYMACDNIDGMHARKTKQSSKLGEFLDHWLDSFTCIVVNIAMVLTLGIKDELLVLYAVFLGIAFFCTIWEHHYTGIFHSGKMGTNEGLLMIIFLYIVLFILDSPSWLQYNGEGKYIVAAMIIFTIIVSLFTALGSVWRVKKHLAECVLLLVTMILAALWSYFQYVDMIYGAVFILASNTVFSGKLIIAHLLQKEKFYRYPIAILLSFIGVIMLLLPLFAVQIEHSYYLYIFYFASSLLAITLLTDGIHGVYRLSQNKTALIN